MFRQSPLVIAALLATSSAIRLPVDTSFFQTGVTAEEVQAIQYPSNVDKDEYVIPGDTSFFQTGVSLEEVQSIKYPANVDKDNYELPLNDMNDMLFATGVTDEEIKAIQISTYEKLPPCNGTNGVRGVDCEAISIPKPKLGVSQKDKDTKTEEKQKEPTCDKFITHNCQPVCTGNQTTGCTEARTPHQPDPERYETRQTFKK